MSYVLSGKTVAIIVAQEFEDIELLYPILRLSEEGARILVVPVREGLHPRPYVDNKPVTGRFGHPVPIPVMAEGNRYTVAELEDITPDEVDCLLFPGGYSPDALRLHEGVLRLTCQFNKQGKLLAAICHGPWVLISARLMDGKRATGYVAVRDDLLNAGAEYVDAPAVVDGNIITGRVPDDLPEFCQAIISELSK
ncbi:MAG: type 1 glutamine amidotransferase [Anaerolineae bacterium]|nr:type 1 glutamine amidotransferase [Anaerolineae bacterium]